jgi:hypothetical protein
MRKKSISDFIEPWVVCFFILLSIATAFISNATAGGLPPLPNLEKAIEEVGALYLGKELSSLADKEFQVRKYYYQIQSRTQKLEILKEVKGHFERAIKKAEVKFNSGEGELSQSAITKLKLGLAGTLNDIIEFESEKKVARLSLVLISQNTYSLEREMSDLEIEPVEFNFINYDTWFNASGLVSSLGKASRTSFTNAELMLNTAYLKAIETREKLELAKQNRKITRGYLVSEVANYDFGIGDPADLFEALIIYTRVLSGYYDSVYNFNLAVADLNRMRILWIGNP